MKRGPFVEATIFRIFENQSAISREEVFGSIYGGQVSIPCKSPVTQSMDWEYLCLRR